MARTYALKKRLAAAARRARPVPAWIIARTRREIRFSNRQRNWRRSARIKP